MSAPEIHHLLPHPARIAAILPESVDTQTFVLEPDPPVLRFDAARPGQFAMLSILGHGEGAFSFSSLPRAGGRHGTVVLTVRRVGSLTGALFALPCGAWVGVRGPFGRGIPAGSARRPTLYVAEGCGLSSLKAAIEMHIAERPASTRIGILYGAREPATRIHRAALALWERTPDVVVISCVELGSLPGAGRCGPLTEFVNEAVEASGARRAFVCGPPVMLQPTAERLCRAGLAPPDVYVTLERHMKCGTGQCGHCYVNHRYVCTDGPTFSFAELSRLPDAFGGPTDENAAVVC